MSVKDDLNKKLIRQREDAAALLAEQTPNDPAAPSVKDYPNAKAVSVTRNGSIVVTY